MDWQKILPLDITAQLEANWTENLKRKGTGREIDYLPVAKLFLPWTSGTWLLSEKEPGTSLCFGLCDLGMGSPELGYVCLEELCSVRGPAGLHVELDEVWRADKKLSEYAREAQREGWLQA